VTTDASHNYTVAPNLLNREFQQNDPVKACVSDLTYIPCKNGFLSLTCVLDLFDRKLIGSSISDHMNASHTVFPAIRMAGQEQTFWRRNDISF
jgi:transposase InsO family protein